MKVDKTVSGNRLDLAVTGRIDTTTAPQLEEEIRDSLDGIEELVMDFSGVEYISSAGLRVLLSMCKTLSGSKYFHIINYSKEIKDILEVTGFDQLFVMDE